MFNPDTLDERKETIAFMLPRSMTTWIDSVATASGENNRSAALRSMLRKLARYEQAEAEGRIVVKKQQPA